MRISFYTTCMGRLHHLRQTLPLNLLRNPKSEFVVLNYNSPDGLDEWMRSNPSPRVCYVRDGDANFYHSSHAKNLAAKAASGDILVNLDADTLAGPGLEDRLVELFSEDAKRLVHVGFTGTIALLRDDFFHLRGYDEALRGWGYDDVDLIARAGHFGLSRYRLRQRRLISRIDHSDEERERLMGISLVESRRKNFRHYRRNRAGKVVQANSELWGVAPVEIIWKPGPCPPA